MRATVLLNLFCVTWVMASFQPQMDVDLSCSCTCSTINKKPESCVEAKQHGGKSGVVTIYPQADNIPLQVYCDQDTDGGGWLVFQRRQDGSVDFYRNWTEYQRPFGSLDGEFWLGLETLHMLTSRQPNELRVDLTSFNGTKGYATYSNFSVNDGSDNYRLHLDGFTGGTAGDSLSRHNDMQFTTWDADHDDASGFNCAVKRHGAWWYWHCDKSNLNGPYRHNRTYAWDSIRWLSFDDSYPLKFTEMKMRST